MDYEVFYNKLFGPVEEQLGLLDRSTIFALIGFDYGGPLNFSTIGAKNGGTFITYISCELAVREDQKPSSAGRFELMCHCNDGGWVREILTRTGAMSLESRLDHLHTIDISGVVEPEATLRGIVMEKFSTAKIDSEEYSILRVHGVTAKELEFAMEKGSEALFEHLKKHGVYPNTEVGRRSTL